MSADPIPSRALRASPSPLDRALRPLAALRPGEGRTALLFTAGLLSLMIAYYLLKTVREPLILLTGGAEAKSYAAAAQALALMLLVPLYAQLASRWRRQGLVLGVTLFFMLCLQAFAALASLRVPMLGFVFYVWVGIFSLSMIAQLWSLANDLYDPAEGGRVFPIIGLGATIGSVIGSYAAGWLFAAGADPALLLQLAFALLLLHLGCYLWILRRPEARRDRGAAIAPLERGGGLWGVLTRPYLRRIALLLLALNLVNTTGEYVLSELALERASEALEAARLARPALDPEAFRTAFIGAFYGEFFTAVNVLAVLLQAFLASRLVRHLGIAGVLFALPIVALGAYALLALGIAFSVFRAAKIAENAADYSLMNTARAMLWLPRDRAEKYKAKQAIDTLIVRCGDLLSAGFVFVGTTIFEFGIRGFAGLNVLLLLFALGLAWLLWRAYGGLEPSPGPSPEPGPESSPESSPEP